VNFGQTTPCPCKDEQFVKCWQNLLCLYSFFLKTFLSIFLNIQKINHSKCDEKICIFYVCLCFHSEFANFHCFLKVAKLIFFLTHFKFEGEKIATAKTNMNFLRRLKPVKYLFSRQKREINFKLFFFKYLQ